MCELNRLHVSISINNNYCARCNEADYWLADANQIQFKMGLV